MAMDGLSAVDVFEKMFFVLHKIFISKLPSLRINFSESIGVELPDEAGEVVVLEIGGKQDASELGGVPHDEARLGGAPGHNLVRRRVVHHLVSLQQEGRRASAAAGLWRCVHCGERRFRRALEPIRRGFPGSSAERERGGIHRFEEGGESGLTR